MARITINHTDRKIEGIYQPSGPTAPSFLLVPPSLEEGGMLEPAMRAVAKGLQNVGFSVFRFDYTAEKQEMQDASLALGWFRRKNPDSSEVWIGGLTVGAHVALQLLMRRPELQRFIALSPPVEKYDFAFLAPCPTDGLLVEAEWDEHSTPDDRDGVAKKLTGSKHVKVVRKVVKNCGRLFGGREKELAALIEGYVATHPPRGIKAPSRKPPAKKPPSKSSSSKSPQAKKAKKLAVKKIAAPKAAKKTLVSA